VGYELQTSFRAQVDLKRINVASWALILQYVQLETRRDYLLLILPKWSKWPLCVIRGMSSWKRNWVSMKVESNKDELIYLSYTPKGWRKEDCVCDAWESKILFLRSWQVIISWWLERVRSSMNSITAGFWLNMSWEEIQLRYYQVHTNKPLIVFNGGSHILLRDSKILQQVNPNAHV
jgi:hypothetical protein